MNIEYTLSIIKPNIISKNMIGVIISRFEAAKFSIVASKMLKMTREQAEGFYAEHKYKFFFEKLIDFMTSGPIIVQVLKREDAIRHNREIMGSTNPTDALIGTLRAEYSDSFTANAVHGSDSAESAAREIAYFFSKDEIFTNIF